MIPGKKYKPEDFVEAAWRRRWIIVLPFAVLAIATAVITQFLPDQYRSEALLQVTPQRVPENIVRPTVTTRLDERLQMYAQQILSRTRLERILQEFELYPDERRTMIMDDVIEMMRTRDIGISGINQRRGGDGGSFRISFNYSDPRTAMLVTERIAALFVRENLQDRGMLAEQTDQFLQSQLQEVERQLKEREKKLETFKQANPGLMPQQVASNQQALSNAQLQLSALQESLYRDRDQLLMIQRQISDVASAIAPIPTVEASTTQAVASANATVRLEMARATLKTMRMTMTAEHPDIKSAERQIKELEQKAADEALQQPVSGPSAVTPFEKARAAKIYEYQLQEDAVRRRVAQKLEEEKKLLATMTAYRQRLDAAPIVESQLTELMRDYTTLQNSYQSLLTKAQDAKIAANLERRQIGEQFTIIDSARLPQRPTSPNRGQLNLMGALAGLAIGLGLAALLEYRDSSLRSEDDVVLTLSLPVLALVPTMTTTADRSRRKRQKLLLASSGALALVISVALIAWKFRLVTDWIR